MSKMKTLVAVAVSLVAVSSALYASPWHHPEMRPEVQMQIDTDAVRANLQDEYAALAKYIGIGGKSQAAYDRYVAARVKADTEHAAWHNKNVPNGQTRQDLLNWKSAHDELRAKLNEQLTKLRGDLVKTLSPEQVAQFDRYEPAALSGCGTRMGNGYGPGYGYGPGCGYGVRGAQRGPGYHGHMNDWHMNGDWNGYHGRRGPGCGW